MDSPTISPLDKIGLRAEAYASLDLPTIRNPRALCP